MVSKILFSKQYGYLSSIYRRMKKYPPKENEEYSINQLDEGCYELILWRLK